MTVVIVRKWDSYLLLAVGSEYIYHMVIQVPNSRHILLVIANIH